MKRYKLFIMMMLALVLVGTAGIYGGKKKAELEAPKTAIKVSDDPVVNQKQILQELKLIKENQAKILVNQTQIMADTKLIRATVK